MLVLPNARLGLINLGRIEVEASGIIIHTATYDTSSKAIGHWDSGFHT
jgi:hypothetical protein